MKNGGTSMEQRAARQVDKILASHTVQPLPDEVQQKIKAIVQREQSWSRERHQGN
jgi:trimethylamine:corrinoid methyltransferase-like protein